MRAALPSSLRDWTASCKKVQNNPMQSRNAPAERHLVRSVKPLPRRTNQRQTRNDRGFRHAAPQFDARRQCAIEGRNQFRILRITFDASGKTVALCHHGPFESTSRLVDAPNSCFTEIQFQAGRKSTHHQEYRALSGVAAGDFGKLILKGRGEREAVEPSHLCGRSRQRDVMRLAAPLTAIEAPSSVWNVAAMLRSEL